MGAPLGWGEMDPGRPVSHLCGLRRNYLQYLAAIPQRIGPTLAHHFAQRLHRVRVRLLSGRQEALCRPRLSDPGRCHDKKFLKTVCLTFTEPVGRMGTFLMPISTNFVFAAETINYGRIGSRWSLRITAWCSCLNLAALAAV